MKHIIKSPIYTENIKKHRNVTKIYYTTGLRKQIRKTLNSGGQKLSLYAGYRRAKMMCIDS